MLNKCSIDQERTLFNVNFDSPFFGNRSLTYFKFRALTSDVERERVAFSVALRVVRRARVHARVGARHLLQHQALVRDDHLLLDVVGQLAALEKGGRKESHV